MKTLNYFFYFMICILCPFLVLLSLLTSFLGYIFPISDFLCYFVVTAIATVVTVAEILKNNGLAVEKSEILCPLFVGKCFPFSSLFLVLK